jgi:hypothetical protein
VPWTAENGDYGRSTDRVARGGDGLGATLAAAVCLSLLPRRWPSQELRQGAADLLRAFEPREMPTRLDICQFPLRLGPRVLEELHLAARGASQAGSVVLRTPIHAAEAVVEIRPVAAWVNFVLGDAAMRSTTVTRRTVGMAANAAGNVLYR